MSVNYRTAYSNRLTRDATCDHCGRTLSYHDFDSGDKLHYCRTPSIDPDKEREAATAMERSGLVSPGEAARMRLTAPDILKRAAQHMEDRAAARDQPGGERSMQRTVDAFNALTGHALTERDGWMFMVALKAARACTTPSGLADDYEDGAAYFGLAGEAAQR